MVPTIGEIPAPRIPKELSSPVFLTFLKAGSNSIYPSTFFISPPILLKVKMMHMTLYWGKEVTLLFDSWHTKSWPSYALTLLLCFLVSLFYQRLEALRLHLRSTPSSANPSAPPFNTPLIGRKLGRNWRIRLGLAALFGVNSALGYLIMLAIMSYNGGVLLAVVLGFTVGYFVFRAGDFSDGDDYLVEAADANTCACSWFTATQRQLFPSPYFHFLF